MKPLLLLILELPDSLMPSVDSLYEQGTWHEPKAMLDSGLATLFTGVAVEAHGALSRWELRPDGQHFREASRHRLKSLPIWERVAGSVSVGVPWGQGSRPQGKVVAADFARARAGRNSVGLPDRVWPGRLNSELSDLRIGSEELDEDTLRELGFFPCNRETRQEIASSLSLHMIGTALLANADAPLAILQLKFPDAPADSDSAARFVEALVERYSDLYKNGELLLLLKHDEDERTRYQAKGSDPNKCFDSLLGMGQSLAMNFGLATETESVGFDHWEALRLSYCPPSSTLPGTSAFIGSLATNIAKALKYVEGIEVHSRQATFEG